jgi:hypothetical protein
MTWSVKSVADGTDISFTYVVGGYAKDGLAGMANMTDKVLGEQIERLKKLVEGEAPAVAHHRRPRETRCLADDDRQTPGLGPFAPRPND